MRGLPSSVSSFLFKMLHQLLPTQDRIRRIGVGDMGQPGLCQLCHLQGEDTSHALFYCHHSLIGAHALLGYIQTRIPNFSVDDALKLRLGEVSEQEEQAVVCTLGTGLMHIWQARLEKKQVYLYKMRAELEAMVSVLRKSRHKNVGEIIASMLN